MAVFTLPPAMMPLFKEHIDFLAEHAVDPDKRRYALSYEGVRHYMDLDHWGEHPFPGLPRKRFDALMRYTELILEGEGGDSLLLVGGQQFAILSADSFLRRPDGSFISRAEYRTFFRQTITPALYGSATALSCDSVMAIFRYPGPCKTIQVRDRLSEHGILPYHLLEMQKKLTEAFLQRDAARILKLAAEMGHYLGDAHVPLHTTSNYDGQLSGQEGIHAFWESRIPELFAEEDFDYLVGKAVYLADPAAFFWEVVLESHRLSKRVLADHRHTRDSVPALLQWCFEPRGNNMVRQPCRAYALAYRQRMEGMVERRMRGAIHAVGSAWYTAWADAGQPDLWKLESAAVDTASLYVLEKIRVETLRSRPHE